MANYFAIKMKKNSFKIAISSLLIFTLCFLTVFIPNTEAATKYTYVANGEKDILGFKISGITQKEDCDTIELNLTATKNVVEFTTYQKVLYNEKQYSSGNYSIDKTRKVKFTYDADGGQKVLPIIIYLTRIESTSCPLSIRYLDDGELIEEVSLTLTASFYGSQANDLRESKKNYSGTLIQENVVVNRPNDPTTAPTEKPTEKPTEAPKPTNPKPTEAPKPTTPKPTTPKPVNPKPTVEPTEAPTEKNEINLPIINEGSTESTEPTEVTTDPTEPTTELIVEPETESGIIEETYESDTEPTEPEIVAPTEPDDEGILDFIKNIDKTYIIIAIAIIILLIILVVVLIIIFSTKKKKNDVPPLPPTQPMNPIPSYIPTDDMIISDGSDISDDFDENNTFDTNTPIEETNDEDSITEEEIISENLEEAIEEPAVEIPVVEELETVEEEVEEEQPKENDVPLITDEFEQLLQSSIPKEELDALRKELAETGSVEDDYSDIVQ